MYYGLSLIMKWLAITLILATELCCASLNPTNTPIKISADSAERNEKLGITTYSGNVSIVQGPLSIDASKVVIHSKEKNVSMIIATGKPASLSKTNSEDESNLDMQASGNTIIYSLESGVIELEEDAKVNQGGSLVSGQKIEYFIEKELVKAQSGSSEDGNRQRVETIIMPSPENEPNNKNSNTDEQP